MRFVTFLLSMNIAVSALAGEIHAEGYENYLDKLAPINNAAVYSCSGNEKRAALAKIEQLLSKLENSLDEVHFNHLATSQVAWEQYVEQHCKLEGYYVGSPMHSVCPMYKTFDRIDELESLLQQGYFPRAKN